MIFKSAFKDIIPVQNCLWQYRCHRLQIVRWGSGELKRPEAVMARINGLGDGLMLGIQTRADSRAGTGPKAGGPH